MILTLGVVDTTPPASAQSDAAPSTVTPTDAGGPSAQLAGYIFDVPVPLSNYLFAKRVSYMFPRPWEEGRSSADRERLIWEALILHYESFRRGVSVSEEELEERIHLVLREQQQTFTRQSDPDAYARWVQETLAEDVELFENQMRYLLQIDTLKDRMRESFSVRVTEDELHEEFLNESHHVGGEMVVFDRLEDAQAFYESHRDAAAWDAMRDVGKHPIRPVSMMTLEAYRDLWSIPAAQLYAFHAMDIGSIGPPMPFGPNEWCVYRLLEKRTGDLAEFPAKRESYVRQVTQRKQYQALTAWTEALKQQARLKVLPAAGQFSWAAGAAADP